MYEIVLVAHEVVVVDVLKAKVVKGRNIVFIRNGSR